MPIKDLVKKAFEDILKHLKSQNTAGAIEVVEKTIEDVQKSDEPATPTGTDPAPATDPVTDPAPADPVTDPATDPVAVDEQKMQEQVKKYVDMYISGNDVLSILSVLKDIDPEKLKELVNKSVDPAKFEEVEKKVEKMTQGESQQVDVEKTKTSVFTGLFG